MEINSGFYVRIAIALRPGLSCLGQKSSFQHWQRRRCSLPVQATSSELLGCIGVLLVFATLFFQTGGSAAFAQATSVIAQRLLAGTVVSSSGNPISAAILILQTNDGRIVARGESDISGNFRFPTGGYIIVANKKGFDTAAEPFVVRSRSGLPRVVLRMEADNGAAVPLVGG